MRPIQAGSRMTVSACWRRRLRHCRRRQTAAGGACAGEWRGHGHVEELEMSEMRHGARRLITDTGGRGGYDKKPGRQRHMRYDM